MKNIKIKYLLKLSDMAQYLLVYFLHAQMTIMVLLYRTISN